MPNELSITLGTNTVSIPLKGTQVQIRAGLKRYVVNQGYSIEGKTEVQIGKMALWLMFNAAKEQSKDRQLQERIEQERATIQAAIDAENNYLDPIEVIAP